MDSTSRRSCLRLPRPKTFLGIMSLQTGTELMSLALVFNKATGAYGLLALLTGYSLSPLQLSLYIINLLSLVLLGLCIPHIRKQTPLPNLALAWLYVVDTVVNAAYTAAFAANWFLETKALGKRDGDEATNGEGDWMAPHETAASMVLIVAFTVVRLYFSLVVMAHARMVLRRYVELLNGNGDGGEHGGNPFAPSSPAGEGWRGKVGRALVCVGRGYWLGKREDEEWTRSVESKFKSNAESSSQAGTD